MGEFDETKIRRDVLGRFTHKPHTEAVGVTLEPMHQDAPDRLSLLETWDARTEQYHIDFDGVPPRFFNAMLLNSQDKAALTEAVDSGGRLSAIPAQVTAHRLTQALSGTRDGRLSDKQVEDFTTDMGLRDLTMTRTPDGGREWVGTTRDGDDYRVVDRPIGRANFRVQSKPGESPYQMIDTRTLVGAKRLQVLTNINPLEAVGGRASSNRQRLQQLQGAETMLERVEAKRDQGAQYRAQRSYMRRQSSRTRSSVWEDKATPADRAHQKMMDETTLNQSFLRVELDNDVDAEEFAEFEADWEEAAKRLPPVPTGLAPTLRIRKLGRHNTAGMYVPDVNTVVVEVRDPSALVREMGHYYDQVARRDASQGEGFAPVVAAYSKRLEMPYDSRYSAARSANPNYYKMPGEVFARGFELWAHERRGVSGRVLNPHRFDSFAYAPFRDETVKRQMFDYFDKEFARKYDGD